MTIQIVDAAEYMTKGEMAYQADYSDGSKVRVVVGRDGMARKEFNIGGEWKLSGKPYIVKSDKTRQGDRLIKSVRSFLAA